MYNIVVVDDHLLFREGIKLLIEKEGFGRVVAEAENGLELIEILPNIVTPDLIIMDVDMPFMNGLEATRRALKKNPNLKILLMTLMSEYTNYVEIKLSGAVGHVLKSSGKKELERAIRDSILQNSI
ncbi:hypothetical protein MASR2M117_21930 [Paludibacter sp.]